MTRDGRLQRELARILKPGGSILFTGPMGHDPAIKLYRRLTPRMRTGDEHPLKYRDILALKTHFNEVDAEYFHLLTLLAVPFRTYAFFETLCGVLARLDSMLFSLPFARRFA